MLLLLVLVPRFSFEELCSRSLTNAQQSSQGKWDLSHRNVAQGMRDAGAVLCGLIQGLWCPAENGCAVSSLWVSCGEASSRPGCVTLLVLLPDRLIAGCAHGSLGGTSIGHQLRFVLHFTPCFLRVSPSWCFPLLPGVEEEIMWETVSGVRGSWRQREGAPSPLCCHCGDGASQGWGRPWCRAAFLQLQHQQGRSDSLKLCQAAAEELYKKYFLRCLFLKYLSKKGGGVQLLADRCAGLLKDQQMWTRCFLNF